MSLRAVFRWKNNDATQDLNLRLNSFVLRGIFSGGLLSPIVGQNTQVSLTPFQAISDDGMTVVEDSSVTLTVVLDQTSVIAAHAVYQVAADPILEYKVYEVSVFNNLVDRDQYIRIGDVTVSSLDSQVPLSGISYLNRDVTDQLSRSSFRGRFQFDGTQTKVGDTTTGVNTIINLPATADIEVGCPITGPNLQPNTVVTGILNSTQITISLNATGTATGQTFDISEHARIGTTTATSNVLSNLTSTTGIQVGWPVSGTNVPAGTLVSSILNGTSVQISQNAAATANNILLQFAALPLADNRPQDFYITGDSDGSVPAIFAWSGISWINITDASAVSSILNQHRMNLLPNEKHLSDDQADAALGSFGSPSAVNRYLTETDPRVLTTNQSAAAGGDYGSPSSSNKFVTQQHPLANPELLFFPLPPGGPIEITAAQGPVYVGVGIVGTANQYFSILHATENKGFLNALNLNPVVVGVFKDAFLSNPLVPSTDADSDGFFASDVYLQIGSVVDSGFRLIYGKRETLGYAPKGFSVSTTPGDEYVPGNVVEKLTNVKGRDFDTLLPTRESNKSLRESVDGLVSFLDSSVETSVVAADEDYLRLENEPVIGNFTRAGNTVINTSLITNLSSTNSVVVGMPIRGTFIPTGATVATLVNSTTISISVNATGTATGTVFTFGDFIKNIGIAPVYTFQNNSLNTFTYNSSNGRIQYAGSPVLTSVQVGNIFRDGAGVTYNVVAVNAGAFTVDVVNSQSGEIPNAVTTSVGTSVDGSIEVNNNPRNLLLSEMKLSGFYEVLPIRQIKTIPDEFEAITGRLGYGVQKSDLRFDPRLVMYGAWENYTDPVSSETFVRNAGAQGDLVITGFFTEVVLLCRRKTNSPSLNIFIDEVAGSAVSTSASSTINNASAIPSPKYQKVPLAVGLPSGRANTVRASILAATTNALEIYGVEIIRSGSTSSMLLEPGRAFRNTEILKRDTLDTAVPIFQIVNGSRGAKTVYYLDDQSYIPAQTSLIDYDESGSPTGSISGTGITVTSGVGKLQKYRVGDLILIKNPFTSEVRRITAISSPVLTIDSVTSMSGSIVITHWGSFDSTIPIAEEDEIVRYAFSDLVDFSNFDFNSATSASGPRSIVAEDGHTQIAGTNLSVQTTGLTGAASAIALNSGGSLLIRALATRIDLITNNTASATVGISINGSPVYNVTISGSGAARHTVLFNARYQTNEVSITPISGTMMTSEVILHGIKEAAPTGETRTIAGAVSQVAGYTGSDQIYVLGNPSKYLLGGVFYPAVEHLSYYSGSGANTDWTYGVDFSKSNYGKYLYSENDGASADFYFVGSGFEAQLITGPDHGIVKIQIDGVDLGSASGTIVGNYASNQADLYSASYSYKNVGMYGLTFGFHRVKIAATNLRSKNVSSSGYRFAISGIYVTNSDGYLSCGLSRENIYSGVEDKRLFLPFPLTDGVSGSGGGTTAVVNADTLSLIEPASGYLATVVDVLKVDKTDTTSKVDVNFTNAAFNSGLQLFTIFCDKSKTVSTTGINYTLNSAPSFTVAPGDVIYDNASGVWRKVVSILTSTTGTLDVAFLSNLSSSACMVSQAVWTKDFVNLGSATEKTRLRDFYPNTSVLTAHADYHDSLVATDKTPDYTDTARLVVALSNFGLQTDVTIPGSDTYSGLFARPVAPQQITNILLLTPANNQRCFAVFFCNPGNGSVTASANLLDYQVSIYEDPDSGVTSGIIRSAFCTTNNTGTPVNASASVVSGKTRISLGFAYIPGLKPGQPDGDLEVILEGEVLPRFYTGVPSTYYKEITTTVIELDTDYSAFAYSVHVRRRAGLEDHSESNLAILSSLQEATVGSAAQVAIGAANFTSLQAAHNAVPTYGYIRMLDVSIIENVTFSKPVTIIGKGRASNIVGNVIFAAGATQCIMKWLRIDGNITFNATANQNMVREVFQSNGKSVTDNATDTSALILQE